MLLASPTVRPGCGSHVNQSPWLRFRNSNHEKFATIAFAVHAAHRHDEQSDGPSLPGSSPDVQALEVPHAAEFEFRKPIKQPKSI